MDEIQHTAFIGKKTQAIGDVERWLNSERLEEISGDLEHLWRKICIVFVGRVDVENRFYQRRAANEGHQQKVRMAIDNYIAAKRWIVVDVFRDEAANGLSENAVLKKVLQKIIRKTIKFLFTNEWRACFSWRMKTR